MTQSNRNPGFKFVAVALVLVLQGWLLPTAAAPEVGSISGIVKTDDGRQPLAGAIVHIAERDSGKLYSSEPAAKDGSFSVGDLPFGQYEIGVESKGGLFLVSVPVTIVDGNARQVALFVTGSPEALTMVGAGRKAGTAGVWSNPLTAALIVVGAAIVVGAVVSATDDDEKGGSPFTN